MKIISTNISREVTMQWKDKPVTTGIYKNPVDAIAIKKYFVEGDYVANLLKHGGERKAVYAYASEHYKFWRAEFPNMEMPWGMFGENISTEGLFEEEAIVGSRYRFGTALLQVVQPRFPCTKLAMKFNADDMIDRFLRSRKSGIYFTVIEEGIAKAKDTITLEHLSDSGISIRDLVEERIGKEEHS